MGKSDDIYVEHVDPSQLSCAPLGLRGTEHLCVCRNFRLTILRPRRRWKVMGISNRLLMSFRFEGGLFVISYHIPGADEMRNLRSIHEAHKEP